MRLATQEVGTGSPVALLHGLFGSARNLGGVARALASRHRVLALDLRNHGDSPHHPVMDYPTMAADVLETLEAAGALPAAVIGHSMGGKVAMRLATGFPGAVSRLAVADIAPVPYGSRFSDFAAAMLAIPEEATRQQADAAMAATVPDPVMRGFLLHNFRPGRGWRIGLAEIAGNLPQIEGWEMPETRYDGPVLFVTGEQSDYVLPAHRPVIQALFPAARFVAIRNAGHWLHADQPAAFQATLAAFTASG